jgi:hypothetical protein
LLLLLILDDTQAMPALTSAFAFSRIVTAAAFSLGFIGSRRNRQASLSAANAGRTKADFMTTTAYRVSV